MVEGLQLVVALALMFLAIMVVKNCTRELFNAGTSKNTAAVKS